VENPATLLKYTEHALLRYPAWTALLRVDLQQVQGNSGGSENQQA
jgi:hypothetical protein